MVKHCPWRGQVIRTFTRQIGSNAVTSPSCFYLCYHLRVMRFRLCGFMLVLLSSTAQAAVTWDSASLDPALGRARAEGKWVLVDMFTSWCESCREMDAKVYARDDVGQALTQGYVALRRNAEEGEGLALAARYHVVGYPTLLVLTPDGVEVDRIMGSVTARDFLEMLARFRSGADTIATLEKRAATSHNPGLLAEVARRHALRGDQRCLPEIEAVIAGDPTNQAGRAAPALLQLGKYYYLRGQRNYAQAARTLERLRDSYPSSSEAGEVPYNLASAYHHLGDHVRALATLDVYLKAAPTAERYTMYVWTCYRNHFGFERALAVAREGLAKFPRSAELWDMFAELLAQEGRRAEALDAARHALALEPASNYFAAQVARFGGSKL